MEKSKTFKKLLACIMVVVMALTAVPMSGFVGLEIGVKVCAENLTEGYYTYTVENGEATITDVDTTISGDIVIPDRLGGYPVVNISDYAFNNCTGLTSIIIPDSVTSIGYRVFSDCISLTSIIIPDSVTTIANSAFYGCTSLTSISIPDSVTSIGASALEGTQWYDNQPDGVVYAGKVVYEYKGDMPESSTIKIKNGTKGIADSAFSHCTGLTSITIPDGVTTIGDYAFSRCTGLTSITIPDSVTNIGNYAFCGCTGLTSITIPDSVKTIGNYAFFDCTGLTSITIPDSVTSIGYHAFRDCTGLTGITIPDSVTSIGEGLFFDCTGLTSITIPDSVTSIGDHAFSYCTGLTSITISNSVTNIGVSAFYGCTGLTSITIPDSVTSIGNAAFYDCTSLTKIDVDDNNRNYSSYDGVLFNKERTALIQYPVGNKRAAYTIPFGVTNIFGGAFAKCEFLTNVTLSNSVTSIGRRAFSYCKNITNVTIENSVTTIFDEAFYGCNSLLNVTIPQSVNFISYHAFGYDEYGEKIDKFTINGYRETEAEIYAVENGFVFNSLDVPHTHSYSSKVTKKATCAQNGVMTYSCTCGDSYTKAIPATGKHTYKTATTKATATADGKTVTACSVCGKVSKTTPIYKASSIKLSAVSFTYNGKVQKPTVTVKNSKGTTLKNGTDYTVAYSSGCKNPGKYAVKVTFKGYFYSGSKTLNFTILPGITSSIATTTSSSAIKLTWKAVPGATGYRVFQYDAKTKKYVTVKTLTGTSYTVSKLKSGTTYKFAVRAYSTVNGTVYWASGYKTVTATTNPGTPTLSVTAGAKKATLKWTKRAEATGYVVYMATSKTGKYTKIATIKNNGTVSMTKTGLTTGKTYYFKVAAYKTVSGKTVYGSYSAVKSVKIK